MSLLLGIETSCDETAAAIVENGVHGRSNVVASQIELHAQYGGVFPELASREHVLKILPVAARAPTARGKRGIRSHGCWGWAAPAGRPSRKRRSRATPARPPAA